VVEKATTTVVIVLTLGQIWPKTNRNASPWNKLGYKTYEI